ncbi:MAG: N-acetylmuramoyl-L-alanine amidase/peptidoglycan recognition protein [Treponematales bacterium]
MSRPQTFAGGLRAVWGAVLLAAAVCLSPAPAFAHTAGAGEGEKTLSVEEVLARVRAVTPADGESGLRWDPLLQSGVLTAGEHRAVFLTGKAGESGPALIDNSEVVTAPQPWLEGGELRFPEGFAAQVQAALKRRADDDRSRFRIAAIIVDPGHGGKDPGAIGNFVINGKPFKSVEKEIALKTAKLLHARLASSYRDKRIILTRTGDTYPSLEDRTNLANSVPLKENEAVIYISLHANANLNRSARGFEIWYLKPDYRRTVIDRSKYADAQEVIPIINAMMEEEFTTESVIMARSILKRMEEDLGTQIPSRGLKAEEWFVVKNSRMPAVLVELGFVTNEKDALLMSDEGYLRKMSEAVYKGVGDFITLFERSGGFTVTK